MSVCRISRNVNQKFCRQALILANLRWRTQPGPTLTRGTHSNLYQMVKKRTLEARTKLQNPKYPNNQPCEKSNSNPKNENNCENPESQQKNSQVQAKKQDAGKVNKQKICLNTEVLKATDCLPPAISQGPEMVKYDPPTVNQRTSPGGRLCPSEAGKMPSIASADARSYGASNSCNVKDIPKGKEFASDNSGDVKIGGGAGRGKGGGGFCGDYLSAAKASGDPCRPVGSATVGGAGVGTGGSGGAGGRSGGGDGSGSQKDSAGNSKLWLAILAALGAGGLLLYLLSGKKDKSKTTGTGQTATTGKPSSFGGGAIGGGPTIPASSADLPKHVPYLLIGGGAASFSAFRAIKSNDATAKVLMITNEHRKPYMRPPLSKELWYSAQTTEISNDFRFKQWTGAERSLYFEPDAFFVDPTKLMDSTNGGIAVAQGFTVKKVDASKRIVTLSDGAEISYDECLIATGCTPKNLPVFLNAPASVKEKVMVFRTPDDFGRLKNAVDKKKSITIIGNGFIGSELACSLANYAREKGVKVYQIFPESGNMSKLLPDYLSKWTMRKVEAQGVCVIPNASIKEAKRDEGHLQLKLSNGSTILTDIAVVSVGCEANTNIASNSSLEVDRKLGGFVVNAELEARRNLFVAGDASCFYDPLLGRRRVEHHDHSVVSGRLAGENMVGKKKAYAHQSMFWSDLGPEIGYEGIGLVDASLPTVGVFALPSKTDKRTDNLKETDIIESPSKDLETKGLPDVPCDDKNADNYGRGVIFYMRDGKIVGILLWNLFNRIGLARTIINQNKKFDDLNEVAKLFEIHS